MTASRSKTWVAPLLAHIAVILASPYWALLLIFSPLAFTESIGGDPSSIIIFVLYISGPIVTIILLLCLWYALIQHIYTRIKVLSYSIILLQIIIFIFLL